MNRCMVRAALFLLLTCFVGSPLCAQDLLAGFSIGNGFNKRRLGEINGEDFQIKESNFAWKIFASTAWNFLGAEGGYRDFGTIERQEDMGRGVSKTRGGDLIGRGVFNFAFLNVFGKAGLFFGRTKDSLVDNMGNTVADQVSRQTAFIWGFGAGINLGILQVRAEYENVELNPSNIGMLSVGAVIGIRKFN